MKITDIRARKALIFDKLSKFKSQYDQWLARRNAAEQAIKRLKVTIGDERRKQIIEQPNHYQEQLKQLNFEKGEFEKADAWLETLSLPKVDVERRLEIEKKLEDLKKETTWKTAPERKQQVFDEQDKLHRELGEISSRDRRQVIQSEEVEIQTELDKLINDESHYDIYRATADGIVDHVNLKMAAVYLDAVKFEDVEYFTGKVTDACRERLA